MKDAAERLDVAPSTIYSLIASGRLKCLRIGVKRGVIRIMEEQLQEYIAGGTTVQPLPLPRYTPKHVKTS